ncbi:NAD(P)H-quinone oxidoreductase subunit H chloroplastic [Bienertia sinuspersici]
MNRGKPMIVPITRKELMIINMGPHHPSMPGVLRLIITLDGEDVIDCEPIMGYLHRATMFTEAIAVNGSKQLGNIQVPKRASYIRVIMLQLSRIASHLLWLSPFMADIGAQTPFSNGLRTWALLGKKKQKKWGYRDQCYELLEYDGIFVNDEFDWEVRWKLAKRRRFVSSLFNTNW